MRRRSVPHVHACVRACPLLQVLIWHYPETWRMPLALETEHRYNLFGVQFLPATNNTRVVSGALYCSVLLQVLDANRATAPPMWRVGARGAGGGGAQRGGGAPAGAIAGARGPRARRP